MGEWRKCQVKTLMSIVALVFIRKADIGFIPRLVLLYVGELDNLRAQSRQI